MNFHSHKCIVSAKWEIIIKMFGKAKKTIPIQFCNDMADLNMTAALGKIVYS